MKLLIFSPKLVIIIWYKVDIMEEAFQDRVEYIKSIRTRRQLYHNERRTFLTAIGLIETAYLFTKHGLSATVLTNKILMYKDD